MTLNTEVEYAPELLDAVRAHVTEGFQRPTAGGVETGGVLFGERSGNKIRVLAMQAVPCADARSGIFALSAMDRQEFEKVLSPQPGGALAGLEPMGWFLSHVRDSLVLRASDQEIFDRYFDQKWQIALVVRPGRIGTLRAATIGRDGEAPEPVVLNEFTIKEVPPMDPGHSVAVRAPNLPLKRLTPLLSRRHRSAQPLDAHANPAPPPRAPRFLAPAPAAQPAPVVRWSSLTRARLAGLLAVLAVVAAIVAVTALVRFNRIRPDTFDLQAFDRDGVLQIEWNPNSRPIQRAVSAKLEIIDGDIATTKDLSHDDLKRGLFATIRRQADITARLRLYDKAGAVKEETTKYAGRPVAKPEPRRRDLDNLKSENAGLRDAASRERRRADDLEKHVKVLEKMLQKRRR